MALIWVAFLIVCKIFILRRIFSGVGCGDSSHGGFGGGGGNKIFVVVMEK